MPTGLWKYDNKIKKKLNFGLCKIVYAALSVIRLLREIVETNLNCNTFQVSLILATQELKKFLENWSSHSVMWYQRTTWEEYSKTSSDRLPLMQIHISGTSLSLTKMSSGNSTPIWLCCCFTAYPSPRSRHEVWLSKLSNKRLVSTEKWNG